VPAQPQGRLLRQLPLQRWLPVPRRLLRLQKKRLLHQRQRHYRLLQLLTLAELLSLPCFRLLIGRARLRTHPAAPRVDWLAPSQMRRPPSYLSQ
jgi:hypothetical protein